MKHDSLVLLQCPFCSTRFSWHEKFLEKNGGVLYGTVSCSCDEFPVISGILFLKRAFSKELVLFLREGKFELALSQVLATKSWMRQKWFQVLFSWLLRISSIATLAKKWNKERLFFYLSFFQGKKYLEYYKNRERKTSVLAYYFPLFFQKKQNLLWVDIGAGMGGVHEHLLNLRPHALIVGIEFDFKLLFITQLLTPHPRKILVCADATVGKLIRQKADIVTCIDSLNYMENPLRIFSLYFSSQAIKKNGLALASNLAEEIIIPDYSYFYPIRKKHIRLIQGTTIFLLEQQIEAAVKKGTFIFLTQQQVMKSMHLYAVVYFPSKLVTSFSSTYRISLSKKYTHYPQISWNLPAQPFIQLKRRS